MTATTADCKVQLLPTKVLIFSLTNKKWHLKKGQMITDIVLSPSDMAHLRVRFEVTSNNDFKKYFTAFVNERRLRMKSDLTITNPGSPLIAKLSTEFCPSIGVIKHFASNRGWKKTAEFLSAMNSKKAKRRIDVALQNKAELVTNPTKWFRSMVIGQTKVGKFETAGKCKSVSSMLARWNHTEGVDSGIFISARYYWDVQVISIKALRRKANE